MRKRRNEENPFLTEIDGGKWYHRREGDKNQLSNLNMKFRGGETR